MVSLQEQQSSFSCLATEAGGWAETMLAVGEKNREECKK